jgi:hypothetical protein
MSGTVGTSRWWLLLCESEESKRKKRSKRVMPQRPQYLARLIATCATLPGSVFAMNQRWSSRQQEQAVDIRTSSPQPPPRNPQGGRPQQPRP